MPKEKERKSFVRPPDDTNSVCAFTYAHMWIIKAFCFLYVHAWFCMICAYVHPVTTTYMCWWIPCRHRMWAAPAHPLNAMALAGSEQGERWQVWMRRGVKGGRGTISLLVTDSSMQTTSPQGRNQEAGPLTQPEEEGGGGAEECKVWPYEQDLWGWGVGGYVCRTDWTNRSALLSWTG